MTGTWIVQTRLWHIPCGRTEGREEQLVVLQAASRMANNVHMSGLLSRHDDEATRTSTSEGLEEGEVEGETLLIVESEDQASVDLSHDQSGDSLNSDEGEASWMEEMSYYCEKCQKWIPASKAASCVVPGCGGCVQGVCAVLRSCFTAGLAVPHPVLVDDACWQGMW